MHGRPASNIRVSQALIFSADFPLPVMIAPLATKENKKSKRKLSQEPLRMLLRNREAKEG